MAHQITEYSRFYSLAKFFSKRVKQLQWAQKISTFIKYCRPENETSGLE